MTALMTVLDGGAETTVQDAGRTGARHLGAPQSGAADRLSFALANAAAGNPWDAPALECALRGPTLRFEKEATLALGGADMNATLNEKDAARHKAHKAAPGDILKLGAATKGLRAYLAVAGGIAGDDFLGSVATLAPAGLGGCCGRALREGDRLAGADLPASTSITIDSMLLPPLAGDVILRATGGPEAMHFDERARAAFFSRPFTADARGNRMGVQLDGERVAPPADFSMPSSPVFPGTVQCPPSGTPYLLLADAQTTGGYGRIAQVIEADLHLAGQIRPGDRVWFSEVTADKARSILLQKNALYSAYLPGFQLG